ncbi:MULTISPECIES: late competence development ComFB family protein [Pseudomonadati]|uniref:Late competence development ComFB family protein n=1 Tax=Shewanella aestuarii TaxID=1028752 RepID=A0ABT0L3N4_9GAMM|nr:late competence development ComFB family protein [Shewanella aestuarii]MCL1118189.1 late competence development ComFB family protein [Shewanella aestuarii]GGN81410.1 competence protein ComFB [Shewanella aestuarii]
MHLEFRNYYEVLLLEILRDEGLMEELPEDYLADLCCVTLNQLPVRYIRHLVDTYFFEDYNELKQMKTEISTALERSRAFLKANLQKRLKEEQETQQTQTSVMPLKHTE